MIIWWCLCGILEFAIADMEIKKIAEANTLHKICLFSPLSGDCNLIVGVVHDHPS